MSEEIQENKENSNNKADKSFLSFVWEITKIIIIAAVIVIPIRYFLFQPFFVKGESMDPSFREGDYLIIDEITYRFSDPERGEVIVFKYPDDPSKRFIKRIIGLPNETITIKDGRVYINQEILLNESYLPDDLTTSGNLEIILGDDQFFVLGDNRPYSFDSRRFGPVDEKFITGRVLFRAWPIDSVSLIKHPIY